MFLSPRFDHCSHCTFHGCLSRPIRHGEISRKSLTPMSSLTKRRRLSPKLAERGLPPNRVLRTSLHMVQATRKMLKRESRGMKRRERAKQLVHLNLLIFRNMRPSKHAKWSADQSGCWTEWIWLRKYLYETVSSSRLGESQVTLKSRIHKSPEFQPNQSLSSKDG